MSPFGYNNSSVALLNLRKCNVTLLNSHVPMSLSLKNHMSQHVTRPENTYVALSLWLKFFLMKLIIL